MGGGRLIPYYGSTSENPLTGGRAQPEFASTHPAPEDRAARIKEEIGKRYPNGVPEGLKK